MALIGDAALIADYLWGVGCGWAFQTAEWLVDATAEALRDGDVDAAQSRLAKQHRARLRPHQRLIADHA